ncbi:MAG: aspartate carbamoyltransferase catalytic subunit [Nitrospirae bacterium]|nr:aspartate carbamoyltransferase catalytic subunit [Nitrospirota bacterium]MBI3352634.1 aspartate carbamoyltransferase catalytic subunit [Nitrospirota bacterium]
MSIKRKDLLALKDLQKEEIELILDTAVSFKEVATRDIKKVPTLRGKTLINLFYEPSTRTRTSFELAAKRLSADVINISHSNSSAVKGESLLDTAKNLEAMNADMIVIRHPSSGAPDILAKHLKSSIINAGDGAHEHPTQGLLDLYTIREKLGRLEGVKVAIVGDITHSRVARSDIAGLTKMGAEVRLVGPPTMIPKEIEASGVTVYYDLKQGIEDVDVVLMLRLQLERQGKGLFPTIREYSELYGLNREKLKFAKSGVLVMHPGPVNRGVEIMPDIADGVSSVILEQVTNGIAVRMAVLFLLSGPA